METHLNTTLYLGPDAQVKITGAGRFTWARVGRWFTIQALDYANECTQVDALEAFFRQGLEAIVAHRNPQLKGMADDGR